MIRMASFLSGLVLFIGVLLPGLPGTAAAQVSANAASLRDRLDPATQRAVQLIFDSAAMAGVPVRPLVHKALEGAAKRAPGERIVNAVRALAADLMVARRALGVDADENTLTAGVGALRAGVSVTYLREFRTARHPTALAWPLTILADLVSRGVPVDTAATVVLSLVRAGATDAAFSSFESQVLHDIGAGVPPGTAAVARAPSGGPPARPSGSRPSTPRRDMPPTSTSPPRPAPPHGRSAPSDVSGGHL